MQVIAQNMVQVRRALESQRFTTESVANSHDLMTDLFAAGAGTHAEQYIWYGQMVLEMSVRRQVDAWGIRLEHAATPKQTIDGDLTTLHGTRDAMMANLADLAVQVGRSTGDNTLQTQQTTTAMPVVASAPVPAAKLVERAESS